MPPGTTRHPVFRYLRAALGPRGEGVADAELVRRFVAGRDEAAFELLMWRHAALVLRVCRGVLNDPADAEDAFQATFLALARKAGALRRPESVAAWLHRAALHAALRVRAQSRRHADRAAREPDRLPSIDWESPDAAAARRELAPLLHEELGRLAAKYRTPILLCYFEGRTLAEAASRLGWAVGTVAGRLARARALLRHRLERRGVVLSLGAVAVALSAEPAPAVAPALVAGTARAVAGAPASPAVQALTEGVLHAMTAVKLKLATAVAVAAVFAVAGGALVSGQFPDQPPDPNSRPPVATRATSGGSTPAAQPPGNFGGIPGGGGTRGQRPPAATPGENARSFNNLKQIALAVHNYVDVNGHFPNIFTDEQGQPTLSWRVALLPYLEQDHLYKQFHLDEPWDSPHNKELLTRMPDVFRAPTQEPGSTDTYYQGFTGRSTLFERGREIHFPDITDGTSNTILVVEGGPPVPWTKPVDVLYSANKPLPRLEGPFSDVLNVAMADGSARALRRPLKESIFRAAITRDGGEVVDLDELSPSQPKPPAAQERGGGAPGDYLNEARMRAEIEAQRAEQARLLEQARLAEQQRADDVARLRRDVEALRDQVQRLQSEVDRLKRGRRE